MDLVHARPTDNLADIASMDSAAREDGQTGRRTTYQFGDEIGAG